MLRATNLCAAIPRVSAAIRVRASSARSAVDATAVDVTAADVTTVEIAEAADASTVAVAAEIMVMGTRVIIVGITVDTHRSAARN